MAIDLSKIQELGSDLKAIQQINLTANLDRGNTKCVSLLKRQREPF